MNLASWLSRAGRAYPDRPALAIGAQTIRSYGAFARRAAAIAAGLTAGGGLSRGDRVAIVAGNCSAYLDALYGIWWAGLAAVPVNAKLHAAEIGWILKDSGARAAFCDSRLEAEIGAHAPETLERLVVLGSPEFERLATGGEATMAEAAPDDLAWLFYTSGTTGRPKGAMLTHRNLAAMSFGYLADVDPTQPGDTLLHAAPMSHGSGLYALPHVCRGAVNAVPESGGFDAEEVLALLAQRPGMSMFAAPTMIKRLVQCDRPTAPENIRTIIWGGAPMHVADCLAAIDRFGPRFAQIYGQGETPMTTTVLSKTDIVERDHPRWRDRLGSAGLANSVVEVRVAGTESDPFAAGEVLVRGDTVMAGYWRNPAATAETIKDGWLHTGDVGAFDAEGYLTLKDRSKDVIISGGSNIYPREIEEVLMRHPGVTEVSVIGRPDPEWGEVPVAYVVGTAPAEALDSLCLETIARFKRPRDYVPVEALPKNNYGKILKTALRESDRAHAGAGAAFPSKDTGQ